MTFGRRLGVAAVCLGVLVVGGCADDEPVPRTSPPSQTPTSASPSPTTPTRQPWERKTDAGAVAFAKHWVETFSLALKTSKTSELRAISDDGCISCAAFAERIEAIRADGGFYRTPGWTVLQVAAANAMPGSRAEIALRILQGQETFKESASAEVERHPVSRASYSAQLLWSQGEWRMMELSLIP